MRCDKGPNGVGVADETTATPLEGGENMAKEGDVTALTLMKPGRMSLAAAGWRPMHQTETFEAEAEADADGFDADAARNADGREEADAESMPGVDTEDDTWGPDRAAVDPDADADTDADADADDALPGASAFEDPLPNT